MRIESSAPGKTILIGEHAAVHGRPAIVAALDRRVQAVLETKPSGGGIGVDLPDLDEGFETTWGEVIARTRAAREAWRHYDRSPDSRSLSRLDAGGPAGLTVLAIGEAVGKIRRDLPGFRLRVRADLPVGAGFGSSAAVAVAVTAAVRRALGLSTDAATLFERAQEVERRQHGHPSGVDAAAATHGGLLWAARGREGLEWRDLEARREILAGFSLHLTGAPAETTGAVVTEVGRRLAERPRWRDDVLGRMEAATAALRVALAGEAPEAPEAPIVPIRDFEACLEEIGVVPEELRRRIRRIETAGGAAKISGAGTLTGVGAGALLVYHPGDDQDLPGLEELPRVAAGFGAPGATSRRIP